MFIGRTDVEAEAPILWPPHGKHWLTGKVRDAGKDWGQENDRRSYGWMASLTRELVMDREAWHAVIHGVAKSRT